MSECHNDKVLRKCSEESSLLEYAYDNRNDNFFNDVTVLVGGEYILANKMILSCCSKYFEEKFKTVKQTDFQLEITDADGKSVKSLIDHIYSGKITVEKGTAFKLLSAANKLRIRKVEQFCSEFITSFIRNNTCFSILHQASIYDCKSLKKKIYKYIRDNFEDIPHTFGFKNLSEDNLLALFQNVGRNKLDNLLLYKSVVDWVNYDQKTRAVSLPNLLKQLKIDQCSISLQLNTHEVDSAAGVIGSSKAVYNRLSPILEKKWLNDGGFVILSLGGANISKDQNNKPLANVTEVYTIFDESLPKFPKLPVKVCAHCSINLENNIYLIGGQALVDSVSTVISDVWQLNLLKKYLYWEKIAPMNEKRWLSSAAVFIDSIVVSGGTNEKERLSSVEVYRKPENIWTFIANMNQPRSGHELVVCDDYLYAIGGWFAGDEYLLSVERLCDLNGKWKFVQPMKIGRRWFASVCWRGEIYVFGGRSNFSAKSRLRSVEKYDPLVNKWFSLKKMKLKRNSHKACVLQNKIIIVGGIGTNGKVVKQIECYDPLFDMWTIVGETEHKMSSHSLVVV